MQKISQEIQFGVIMPWVLHPTPMGGGAVRAESGDRRKSQSKSEVTGYGAG